MTAGLQTIIYPVNDLAQAKALFTALLGVEPAQDEAYYVGYQVAGQSFGLDPNGHSKGMTGPVGYVHVDDIDKSLAAMEAAGGTVSQQPTKVGGTRRIATVTDADGNVIGVLQD
ncbi:VOC family protein [Nocardia sp. NPDC059180]|uniref:VOC family protein n=1 Tax=Nocardia sp. NPDC059180 TaxID=3346761 RepID=UPI00369751B4